MQEPSYVGFLWIFSPHCVVRFVFLLLHLPTRPPPPPPPFLLLPSNNHSNNCIDVKLGDEVGLIGAFAFLTFVCHLESFQSCDVYAPFFKRPMPASRRPEKSLHWHQVLALQFSHMLYCSTTFGTGTLETTNFDSSILFSRRTATKDCRIQRVELLEPAFCRTTLSIVSLRSEPRFP